MGKGPLNSARPVASIPVGGVYNLISPSPSDNQALALQVDNEGNLLVNVAVGGGGGSDAAVGRVGSAAPLFAIELGIVDDSGNLQTISAENPLQITGTLDVPNLSVSEVGTAIPPDATMIGGSDGTDLRAVAVDTKGNVGVTEASLDATIGVANGASSPPANAILLGAIAKGSGYFVPLRADEGSLIVEVSEDSTVAVTASAGAFVDGALTTFGYKADAANSATDTTPISVMSVLKEISYMAQHPASVNAAVSGTVTVNQGTAGASAWPVTEATLDGCISNGALSVVNKFPVVVQKVSFGSTGSVSSLVCAYGQNVQAGTTLIIVASVGNTTTPTIADTLGNLYQKVNYSTTSGAFGVGIWFAVSWAAGANTITVSNGGSACSIAAQIYEVSGLAPGSYPEGVSANSATSSTLTTGTPATTFANEFFVLGVAVGTAARTITVPTSGSTYYQFLSLDCDVNPTTPAGLFSFGAASGIRGVPVAAGTNTICGSLSGSEPVQTVSCAFVSAYQALGGVFAQGAAVASFNVAWPVKLTDGTNTQSFMSTAVLNKYGADINVLSILGTAPSTAGKLDVILNAETTKVIGVARTSDGSGNLLTSNSATPSGHYALDENITSILGTAPSTAGKLDVKSVDGDVFVRSNAAATFPVTATIAASQTIAVTQSTAASLNATVTPVTGAVFPVVDSQGTRQSVTFTSGTPADTANTVAISTYANVGVSLHYVGSVTGGQMFFEVSDDNSNWYGISMAPTDGDTDPVDNYTLASANGAIAWQMFVGAFVYFRVRMHTQVVGDGSAIVAIIPSTLTAEPAVALTGGFTKVNQGAAEVGAKWSVQVDNSSAIPVSLASLPSLASGSALVGGVEIYDGAGTNKLAVDASGQITIANTSFNVGTVTTLPSLASGSNIIGKVDILGNTGVALDAVLGATKPANCLQVGGNDGTNAYAVPLASGGTSVLVSGSVTASGTVSVSGSVAVTGTFWQAKQPVTAADGDVFVRQATGSNLHTVLDSGTLTSITNTVSVAGTLTNNNTTPGGTNIGAMPAQAGTGKPSYNNGNLVLLSTELDGDLRVSVSEPIPAGTNVIGHVIVDSGAITASGTVATTPPSHASTNVDEWNGNTVDTNSGSTSAGTLRVVIATDQPQLSNKLLVTADPITFASAQPVTGTFWQSTQPVSLASLPAITFASAQPITEASLDATIVASGTTAPTMFQFIGGKTNDATAQYQPIPEGAGGRSIIVEGVSGGTAVPVSGTFWQATQPVSGSVSVSNFPATQPVSGTVAVSSVSGSVAVTGTFWQATQPVSIASMPSTPVTGTFWQSTQPVSLASLPALATGTNVIGHVIVDSGTITTVSTVTAVTAITNALPTGTNSIGTVNGPTLTKGTQGSVGFSVQDLKDAGRTQITLYVDSLSGITTEALATLNITKGLVAQTAATSYTVTSGKTLRIQSITLTVVPPSTTAATSRIRVRAAATVAASSPVIANVAAGSANVAFYAGQTQAEIPEGLEVAGGQQIGISHIESSIIAGSTTTGAGVSFCLIGYEY